MTNVGQEARPLVPSVRSAMRILVYLRERRGRTASLAEISRSLEINRSTCLNVLREMQQFDVIRYDPETKRYGLGYALIGMGHTVVRSHAWYEQVHRLLDEWHRTTGLTAMVAQPTGDRMLVMDKVESVRNIHIGVPIGTSLHLLSGSLGKCYLAFASPETRREILSRVGLPRLSEHSITDIDEYERELDRTRAQGYAVSFGEFAASIHALAAPVFNGLGDVALVIAVTGFSNELPPEQLHTLGPRLAESTQRLSAWAAAALTT